MKIGVVGHVSREDEFNNLCKIVDADYRNLDDGSLGCLLNHRRVWSNLDRVVAPADWGLVLEDDAVPCMAFRQQAEAALRRVPQSIDVVSFYLGQQYPPQHMDKVAGAVAEAKRADAHWITADVVMHGVAVAIRGLYIGRMLMTTLKDHPKRPMDEAITLWCRRFGHDVAYTFPSLVDHADLPTCVAHPDGEVRGKGRVAWQFGKREYWTQRSVPL